MKNNVKWYSLILVIAGLGLWMDFLVYKNELDYFLIENSINILKGD